MKIPRHVKDIHLPLIFFRGTQFDHIPNGDGSLLISIFGDQKPSIHQFYVPFFSEGTIGVAGHCPGFWARLAFKSHSYCCWPRGDRGDHSDGGHLADPRPPGGIWARSCGRGETMAMEVAPKKWMVYIVEKPIVRNG